jgi:hypothetical protein
MNVNRYVRDAIRLPAEFQMLLATTFEVVGTDWVMVQSAGFSRTFGWLRLEVLKPN